jgi:sugar lactone lactonase YvrE
MSNNKDFKVKNGIQPTVYHEGLGTVVSGSEGYYLSGASYDSVSFSVASQDSSPNDLFFKPDGTAFYIVGASTLGHQYALSTAWDLSTASYANKSFDFSSQASFDGMGLTFKPDGTKMYMSSESSGTVYQYSLSTAWDISTGSYDSKSLTLQSTNPQGLSFNADGTKLFTLEDGSDLIYQYSLTTAYDISTASYDSISFAPTEAGQTRGLTFSSDGLSFFVASNGVDAVYKYTVSSAYDISSAVYSSFLDVSSQESAPAGVQFKSDGAKMYVVGNGSDTIYQYSTILTTAELDLSTGSVFEVTPTSDIQVSLTNPAASGTSSGATLLLDQQGYGGYDLGNAVYADKSLDVSSQEATSMGVQFKPDGTKMYIVGSSGDEVNEYALTTAWDITTASFITSFSVSGQHTNPRAMAFKSDGTVMYITGITADAVSQYTLSTAWDVSTASYTSQFSVSSQEDNSEGLFFKTDGTKMYITGGSGDDVNEYTLSTAWDVTTASYTTVFSVISQATTPSGLAFNDTGTTMFVLNRGSNTVFEYTLSTAWDISTASYNSVSYVLEALPDPSGITFKTDGTIMYIIDYTDDKVYQYSTATPATITYDPTLEWPGGTAPTAPAKGETDVLTFNTRDGGSTYQGVLAIDGAK